jgi:hypothetical protein
MQDQIAIIMRERTHRNSILRRTVAQINLEGTEEPIMGRTAPAGGGGSKVSSLRRKVTAGGCMRIVFGGIQEFRVFAIAGSADLRPDDGAF